MTHPHHLHALAAAWSLTDARQRLDQAAAQEARQQRTDALITAAAAGIQAWRPTIGRTSGTHGDPVGLAVLGGADAEVRPLRPGPLARLAASVDDTLRWLAGRLTGIGAHRDPLAYLRQIVSCLPPAAAAELSRWLGEADARVRDALQLGRAERLLAGVPCPACSTRLLHVQTTALYPLDRTVICRAGCTCDGPGCPCGMEVLELGVGHIWLTNALPFAATLDT
jgi:hypothetical protein